ncbi:hypothetical protein C8R44DRAFT_879584 [Mycena epipterygia]|nr:hypothetical protein C8R44DRAFT_879584 [Mycena epipterygia]
MLSSTLLRFFGWPLHLITLSILVAPAAGVVTSSWRRPNVRVSPAARITTAAAALEKAIDMLNVTNQFDGQTYEVVGTVYSQMAEFDIVTNQRIYHDSLQRTYGYAAIRAYTAYQDPVFLQYANQSWSFGRAYTISQTAGNLSTKDVPVQGRRWRAGRFGQTTTPTDPSVAAMSTGYFLVLSTLMAEATSNSNPIYLTAALESAAFIRTHLYNNNLVQQSMSARQNDSCAILDATTNSYNSDLFVEGLATLVSLTRNVSTQALLDDLITEVLSNPAWQTYEGISDTPLNIGDSLVVRALASTYRRNATSPEVRVYVQAYLGVQFNAVTDFATSDGTNIYSGQWTGPPSAAFSQANQTGALSVLLAAALLPASDNSTTSATASGSPAATASQTTPSLDGKGRNAHQHAAAIAGGVVGAVVIVEIAVFGWFIMRRRARVAFTVSPTESTIHPFSATQSTAQLGTGSVPFFPVLPPPASAPASRRLGEKSRPQAHTHTYTYSGSAHSGSCSGSQMTRGGGTPKISISTGATVGSSAGSSAGGGTFFSPVDLPTSELIMLLNARLQGRTRDDEAEVAPPEYRDT